MRTLHIVALFLCCAIASCEQRPAPRTEISVSEAIESPYNWRRTDVSLKSVNPGAYIRLGFTGTSIKVNLSSPSFTGSSIRLTAIVDNVRTYNSTISNSATSLTLAAGLTDATHQMTLYYDANDATQDVWTTPTMALNITSFSVDNGKASAAPTLRSKRMICFGDSVSYGIAALRSTTGPTGHSAVLSPMIGVAQALDAEIGIVGFGSQGYGKTGLGNAPRVYDAVTPANSGWDKYYSGQSRLDAGLLSPEPDYIVMYHGTADYTGSASDANVTAGVQGMLPALRTAAPNAYIFCIVPANRQKLTAITTGFENAFTSKSTLATVGPCTIYSAGTDSKAFLIDLGVSLSEGINQSGTETWQAIDRIHPDGPTNGRIAVAIAACIQRAISPTPIFVID